MTLECPCKDEGRDALTTAELRPYGSGCTGLVTIPMGEGERPIVTGAGYVCNELARLRRMADSREAGARRIAAMKAAKAAKDAS